MRDRKRELDFRLVVFDRSCPSCLPVHVRFAPKADLSLYGPHSLGDRGFRLDND